MDINLKVTLDAPELMAALLALAEAIPRNRQAASAMEVQATLPVEAAAADVTIGHLREKIAGLTKAGKVAQVRALVKNFGGSKLTEVPEKNYEALYKEIQKL